MIETGIVQTPVGFIQMRASVDALFSVDFLAKDKCTNTGAACLSEDGGQKTEYGKDCSFVVGQHVPTKSGSVALSKAFDELNQYFLGRLSVFTVPIVLNVTPFQKKVLERMRRIPFGKTMTYGELAKEIGGCAQAIGQVCRRNLLPIVIPCHRVVGANDIGGFCGSLDKEHLSIKQWLLRHETA